MRKRPSRLHLVRKDSRDEKNPTNHFKFYPIYEVVTYLVSAAAQVGWRLWSEKVKEEGRGIREEKLKMASTFFIFAIIFSTVAVLAVEGTARGAVPLDTLTFDKVFL